MSSRVSTSNPSPTSGARRPREPPPPNHEFAGRASYHRPLWAINGTKGGNGIGIQMSGSETAAKGGAAKESEVHRSSRSGRGLASVAAASPLRRASLRSATLHELTICKPAEPLLSRPPSSSPAGRRPPSLAPLLGRSRGVVDDARGGDCRWGMG
ncbi:hypothetical protein TIFTF001_002408 [Ficus carica]|uniref:Uncharacterized protein n=1 Tax=Ficus carica TaxID=3494 RepID=A0AA87Z5X3_FICCA|nr:hypothetical protein TIFTF001_002408 [Ficus carica]